MNSVAVKNNESYSSAEVQSLKHSDRPPIDNYTINMTADELAELLNIDKMQEPIRLHMTKLMMNEADKKIQEGKCPECSCDLIYQEGCKKCLNCGFNICER